jgi:hypothetical protein
MKDKTGDQTARIGIGQTPKDRGHLAKIGQTVKIRGLDHSAIEGKEQKHGQIQTLLKPEV